MEIYLNTNTETIRLPILPQSFERFLSTNIAEDKVIGLGDIAMFNGNGLSKITLESFFPNRPYHFNTYSPVPEPYEFVSKIGVARQNGTPVRLIITGTNINRLMLITDFSYGEQDCTGDVYYTIDLIEYRPVTIPKIANNTNSNNSNSNSNRPSDNNSSTTTQKIHKVKKGDCLWDIAKKYYGKGSLYPKIREANTSKYPSLKKSTIIHIGWELIIP